MTAIAVLVTKAMASTALMSTNASKELIIVMNMPTAQMVLVISAARVLSDSLEMVLIAKT